MTPDPDLVLEARGLEPGVALDLGCGAGGNALWLASLGWAVTALDVSPSALEALRACAAERGLQLETVVADLLEYRSEPVFDLVLMCFMHLRPRHRSKMLATARSALRHGGTLVYVAIARPASGPTDDVLASPEQIEARLSSLEMEIERSRVSRRTMEAPAETFEADVMVVRARVRDAKLAP